MENLTIGDLFSGRVPFVVEKYQRDYAWDSTEIEDFINDVMKLFLTYDPLKKSKVIENPKRKRHFFGGIVSIEKQVPQTSTGRVFEVVDGQQRLATFTLSLSLVVNSLNGLSNAADQTGNKLIKKKAKIHADQTDTTLIHYLEIEEDEKVPYLRLKMSKPDSIFFENLINGDNPTPSRKSHELLVSAYSEIKTKLVDKIIADNSSTEDLKFKALLKLLSCLTDNCHIIHIVSDDKKEAYRLFTVLNDRGRALSDGDLLRSFTLELLENNHKLQGQVESYWDTILSIDKSEIEIFLRNFYASNVGSRAAKRDLNDQFLSTFFTDANLNKSRDTQIKVQKTVERMLIEFQYHQKLADGIWPYEQGKISDWENNRLNLLINVLKHTLSLPLLLSARYCLDEEKFSKILSLIERAGFRYILVVGGHPGKLEKIYLKNALSIRNNPQKYQIKSLEDDLHQLILIEAPDKRFENNLNEFKYVKNGSQQNRVIKYFFTTLDDHFASYRKNSKTIPKPDKTQPYDLDEISIEHIHAQKPLKSIPSLDPLVNDIGNLTIWAPDDNRAAGNSDFTQKKIKYKDSKIHLTKELSTYRAWNKKSVEKRQEELTKMAKKIFFI
ncbi:MAG: DUF262 domain-containing HNH endonuclease family protein [Methanoregula sp.]|nr:DUF262 domain-containing HNH endonuclease family protein [Methanoregula sp.]